MVAPRRRIVASSRRRAQIIWAAAALLTVVGAAVSVAQPPTATPTPTASASPTPHDGSPTPGDGSPTPGDGSPRPGGTSPALTPQAPSTATTAESLTPTGAPSSSPSERTTPGASPTSAPAQPESSTSQRPATPPASSTGAVPLSSVLIALAVLVLVSLVLLRLARKGEAQVAQPEAAPPRSGTEPATDVLVLLASAGEALIDSGFDVDDVDANLEEIARAYGMADTEIIALPTALLVSSGTGGRLRTRAVTSGRQRLRLHQVEELDDVVRVARTGRIDPRWAHDQIVAIRTRPPPFCPSMQLLGQVLATVLRRSDLSSSTGAEPVEYAEIKRANELQMRTWHLIFSSLRRPSIGIRVKRHPNCVNWLPDGVCHDQNYIGKSSDERFFHDHWRYKMIIEIA
jgi:Putative threonine/serine exporter